MSAAVEPAQDFLHPESGHLFGGLDGVRSTSDRVEAFYRHSGAVIRTVQRRDGGRALSVVARDDRADGSVTAEEADAAFLRMPKRPPVSLDAGRIRVLDLFSGCGGLTLGLGEAARALGLGMTATGIDSDPISGAVFADNFADSEFIASDLCALLDGEVGSPLTLQERALRDRVGEIEVVVGGPPCQGHSAFNNRTRHNDVRNDLYLRMVRAAEVFTPDHVVVENVPGALRDRSGVVQRASQILTSLGYQVAAGVVDAVDLGVAQRRKRLLVVASQRRELDPNKLSALYGPATRRNLQWAIGDIEASVGGSPLTQVAASVAATRRRIDYLFENDLYELPNDQRPACHAKGGHSYRSIYGRLNWDEPAQTLTTGFYCMCMGRYVHPSQRRTLTAWEAARIQFFPDWFDFSTVHKRGDLARLIGNAVPLKIGYVVGLELLR